MKAGPRDSTTQSLISWVASLSPSLPLCGLSFSWQGSEGGRDCCLLSDVRVLRPGPTKAACLLRQHLGGHAGKLADSILPLLFFEGRTSAVGAHS